MDPAQVVVREHVACTGEGVGTDGGASRGSFDVETNVGERIGSSVGVLCQPKIDESVDSSIDEQEPFREAMRSLDPCSNFKKNNVCRERLKTQITVGVLFSCLSTQSIAHLIQSLPTKHLLAVTGSLCGSRHLIRCGKGNFLGEGKRNAQHRLARCNVSHKAHRSPA